MVLILLLSFAFRADTWPVWDAFCGSQPFMTGDTIVAELGLLHEAGVWGMSGEILPSAAEAMAACRNYAKYRVWLREGS